MEDDSKRPARQQRRQQRGTPARAGKKPESRLNACVTALRLLVQGTKALKELCGFVCWFLLALGTFLCASYVGLYFEASVYRYVVIVLIFSAVGGWLSPGNKRRW